MREYLLGALGVALAYPAIWYQMDPEGLASHPEVVEAVAATPEAPLERAPRAKTNQVGVTPSELVWEPDGAVTGPTVATPAPPRGRTRHPPTAPFPEALPKTIDQMSELQRFAHDPVELAKRVQRLPSNEAELDELKAFAEKFVTLPPDRVEQQLNPEGRTARARSRSSPRR